MTKQLILAGMILSTLAISGCSSRAGTGALIGAAAGAVAGRATGDHSDQRTKEGAMIGAAAGAIIGNEQEKRRKQY